MRIFLFLIFGIIVATLASESEVEEGRKWGVSWWGFKPKYPKQEKESMSEEESGEVARPEVMPFPRPFPKPRPYPKPAKPIPMFPRNFFNLFRHICRKEEIDFPTCERFERIWIFATSCDNVNEGDFKGEKKGFQNQVQLYEY